MSDFGAIIYIDKKDKSFFTEKEIKNITSICDQVRNEIALTNSLGEPYLFSVGRMINLDSDYSYKLNVLLSNHWGDASQFKWHKEIDGKDMKVIASTLRELLPKEYKLQAKFEWW